MCRPKLESSPGLCGAPRSFLKLPTNKAKASAQLSLLKKKSYTQSVQYPRELLSLGFPLVHFYSYHYTPFENGSRLCRLAWDSAFPHLRTDQGLGMYLTAMREVLGLILNPPLLSNVLTYTSISTLVQLKCLKPILDMT